MLHHQTRKGRIVQRHFRGDRLKALRIRDGLTQAELAVKIGASEKQANRWEKQNVEPTGHHLLQLAKLFNVTIEYLLGVSDDPGSYEHPRELSSLQRRVLDAMDRGDIVALSGLLAQFVREQAKKGANAARSHPNGG